MKQRYFLFLFFSIIVAFSTTGCKKFLNIDDNTAMSGNNFWKSKDDVEKYTRGAYSLLRESTCSDGYTLLGIGDLRSTAWLRSKAGDPSGRLMTYISLLNQNYMNSLTASALWWNIGGTSYGYFGFSNLKDWTKMYQVIAAANNILANIDSKDILNITQEERELYRNEALFVRSISYYLCVRHWGDVPYVTDFNDRTKHARMDKAEVFKNCVKDLEKTVNVLPWTYADPKKVGARAMKGGSLALLMELNMWLACFDEANRINYYNEVVKWGNMLINENGGVYQLMGIDNTKDIFKGNSRESLFEIGQNVNNNETFGKMVSIAGITLKTPYKPSAINTYAYYATPYLQQLYLADKNGTGDKRMDLWFEPQNMWSDAGDFVFKKFINTASGSGADENPLDAKILFRYADAYLLLAEAEANLQKYADAVTHVNVIRQRAGAELYTGTQTNQFGQTIDDAIWFERERELMGESSMFYDLVRSKRILNSLYTPNPMSYGDYLRGAWTYPISDYVISTNSKIQPNTYWQ